MPRVRTNDGRVMEIEMGLVQDCRRLKMVVEMTDSCDFSMHEILLKDIDAAIMETVVRFFETGSIPEFRESLLAAAESLGYEKLQHILQTNGS